MLSREEKSDFYTSCIEEAFAKMRIDNPEDLFIAAQCMTRGNIAALSTMNKIVYSQPISEALDPVLDLHARICQNLSFAVSPFWPKPESLSKDFVHDVLHGSTVILLSKAAILSEGDPEHLSLFAEICKVAQACVVTALISTIRLPGRNILKEEDSTAITESAVELMQEMTQKFLGRWQEYIKEHYGVNMSMGPLFEE